MALNNISKSLQGLSVKACPKELMAYKALNSMHFTFVVGWGIKGCPPSPHKRANT
jgi:hypothetical protein